MKKKNTRVVSAALLAALILLGCIVLPESTKADGMLAKGYVTATKINVYSSANPNSTILDTLGKNVTVSVYSVLGEYLYVTVPSTGTVGYVPAKYVSLYSDSFAGYGLGIITGDVHLRQSDTSSSKSLAICHKDDVLILLSYDADSGWYRVKNGDEVKGYVSGKYCKVICKADKAQDTTKQTGYINGEDVNFRSGPGTEYTSQGKLSRNTAVQILSTVGKWTQVKVKSTGKTGYVYSQYVSKDPGGNTDPDISGDKPASGEGSINHSGTNIRSGPGTEYTSYGQLNRGTKLTILAVNGSWYKVRLSSSKQVGYVYMTYVALSGEEDGGEEGYVNAQNVHLRKTASSSSSMLATLDKYTYLDVLGFAGEDWYKVYVPSEGKTGYIYRKYVSFGYAPRTPTPITPVPTIRPVPTPDPVIGQVSAPIISIGGIWITLADGYTYTVNGANCTIVNSDLVQVGNIATISYRVEGDQRIASRAVFTASIDY